MHSSKQMHRKKLCLCSHSDSAQYCSHSPLEHVPSLVPMMHHGPESAGCICTVLPRQSFVLVINNLQLGQALMYMPLENLKQ